MSKDETPQEIPTIEVEIPVLEAVIQIIAIAAQRGAISPQEMSTVGAVFNHINQLLPQVEEADESQEEEQTSPIVDGTGQPASDKIVDFSK